MSSESFPDSPNKQPVELDGLCASCNAGCCQQGTFIPVSQQEYDAMTDRFGPLYEGRFATAPKVNTRDPESPRWMTLAVDCPALDPETLACTMRGNPDRPAVCDEFKAGSESCKSIRETRNFGVAAIRFENRRRLAISAKRKET